MDGRTEPRTTVMDTFRWSARDGGGGRGGQLRYETWYTTTDVITQLAFKIVSASVTYFANLIQKP